MIGHRFVTSLARRNLISSSTTVRSLSAKNVFTPNDQFLNRHVGTIGEERQSMLDTVGFSSLEDLVNSTVPQKIRLHKPLNLDHPLSETEAYHKLKQMMSKNKVLKSFIGMGYYETALPAVIQRNVRLFSLVT
jgi:glycine dehydrogenase